MVAATRDDPLAPLVSFQTDRYLHHRAIHRIDLEDRLAFPPNQMFWAILTTIAFALAAFAILMNRQARLAMRLMTLMLAMFGVLVWIPRLIADPKAHSNWSEWVLTFLITGAAWTVAELKSL
jgi:hypothetical protein